MVDSKIKEWKRGLVRTVGDKWIINGEIRIWNGNKWLCEHGKQKCQCKKCGGSSFCDHGKRKNICAKCDGSDICEHGKRKNRCVKCDGSSICEHKKVRTRCKKCGGRDICEHGSRKDICKKCGGSQICVHGIRKSICKTCEGSQVCEHKKIRAQCIECEGSDICRVCKVTFGNRKYDKLCVRCAIYQGHEVKHNYKTKEISMVEFIREHTNVDWIHDKIYDLGCSKKRPDLVCDVGSHIIVIECDENSHKNYSCENKRLMEISQDFSENNIHRPVVFIRFNPDKYVNNKGEVVPSCWKEGKDGILRIQNEDNWNKRLITLLEATEYHLVQIPNKEITIKNLFYDETII